MLVKLSNWLFKLKCKYWNKYYAIFPRNLDPKNYHPHSRRLIFGMMEIVQSYLDLKYGTVIKEDYDFDEMDSELVEIAYWWTNIFLPKSQSCYSKVVNAENETELFRASKKIEKLMADLEDYLHLMLDCIPQMGI